MDKRIKPDAKFAVITFHGGDHTPRINVFNSLAKAVDFFDATELRVRHEMRPKWLGEIQIKEHE